MCEMGRISSHDQKERLDEAQAAELAAEVMLAAGARLNAPEPVLCPDGPERLDVNRDNPRMFAEHWAIIGIWVTTIAVAVWRLLL